MPETQKRKSALRLYRQFDQAGDAVARLTWSPTGKFLAVAAREGVVTIVDVEGNSVVHELKTKHYHVYSVVWSPDDTCFAISSDSRTAHIYDRTEGKILSGISISDNPRGRRLEPSIMGLAWSPDGDRIATGSDDGLRIWDARKGTLLFESPAQRQIHGLAWSPNGTYLASSSYEPNTCVWMTDEFQLLHRFEFGGFPALAWSPDSAILACSDKSAIRIQDISTGKNTNVLEAHTSNIRALSFSSDGLFLASRAARLHPEDDKQIIIWRTDEWKICEVNRTTSANYIFGGLQFSPVANLLAAATKKDNKVTIWKYDPKVLSSHSARGSAIHYKNAKVALLGNSGVGKSGLALVLNGKPFAPTISTHGRSVSALEKSERPNAANVTELREVLLWDLAGQPGYRVIHQLHLDDVDVGVIVFDSKDESDPLAGIRHWSRALDKSQSVIQDGAGAHVVKLLVAARVDRGPVGVSEERIEQLLKDLNIKALFKTSSMTGLGVEALRRGILDSVVWDDLPTITSDLSLRTVRSLVEAEISIGRILITLDEIRALYQKKLRKSLSSNQVRLYIDRLQRLGVVRRFSFGNLLLLKPELLDSYASSMIFAAKQEPDGMGSIPVRDIRPEMLPIPDEDKLLTREQDQLMLLAVTEDLLRHEVALRESSEAGEFLIFPSQLTRENPELPDPEGKETKIVFTGPVDNIYASLVVRLAHSELFKVAEMWKNATLFRSTDGALLGFFLKEEGEGSGSLTLFYEARTHLVHKQQFERYVTTHILRKAVPGSVKNERFYFCLQADCRISISETAVAKRRERGFNWIDCNVCGSRIDLSEVQEGNSGLSSGSNDTIDNAADASQKFEETLISASGEMLTDRFKVWAGGERATIAIVFTDIVGSTKLAVDKGDEEMWSIREQHFSLLRTYIQNSEGYLIKTIGDSVMAAFRTANQALDFARLALYAPGSDELVTRAGIHVGPVRIGDEDAFGSMVNYSARVVGSIDDSAIRLSQRAYEDIAAEKAKKFRNLKWKIIENLQLKGFSGSQTLWEMS
jgi:WD40 repeat protein/class 3 adenylate cyclase